jgi:hypothetical protein
VYRTLPTLVRALARATRADAVNVLSQNGRAGGQTVFHLHFHLIPIHRDRSPLRREGRRVTLEFVQQPASRAALDRIARSIRGHLAGARSPGGASPRRPGGKDAQGQGRAHSRVSGKRARLLELR